MRERGVGIETEEEIELTPEVAVELDEGLEDVFGEAVRDLIGEFVVNPYQHIPQHQYIHPISRLRICSQAVYSLTINEIQMHLLIRPPIIREIRQYSVDILRRRGKEVDGVEVGLGRSGGHEHVDGCTSHSQHRS